MTLKKFINDEYTSDLPKPDFLKESSQCFSFLHSVNKWCNRYMTSEMVSFPSSTSASFGHNSQPNDHSTMQDSHCKIWLTFWSRHSQIEQIFYFSYSNHFSKISSHRKPPLLRYNDTAINLLYFSQHTSSQRVQCFFKQFLKIPVMK